MPNIRFVSGLGNYTQYEKLKASLNLLSQLAQGEQAGKEKGWRTIEDVEAELGIIGFLNWFEGKEIERYGIQRRL